MATEQEAQGPQDKGSDDLAELVSEAVLRLRKRERNIAALLDELSSLRQQTATFERKYAQSFEEFQTRIEPEADPEMQTDYLNWSRLAEHYRLVLSRLQRLLTSSGPLAHAERGRKRA